MHDTRDTEAGSSGRAADMRLDLLTVNLLT